ncbi:MAG: histidine phosphatase family protein [Actinomycetota bacterium]
MVYLVRHGRTLLNAEGRFRGRIDVPLDEDGRSQAEAAAERLTPSRLAAAYSSPLRRAVETARPIAARHGLEVQFEEGLIDLDHGAWEGLTPSEAETLDPQAYGLWLADPLSAVPPGGEPVADALARTHKALVELLGANRGGSIVAVSHEIVIRAVIAEAHRLTGKWVWSFGLEPGSITELRLVEGRLVPS